MSPRDVLNELKWNRKALERARITYVHRGAPGDERTVHGSSIVEIGSWYFALRDEEALSATIPYHRVLRIALDDGELVWERR